MAARPDVRQAESGHPHEPAHVRLEHRGLVGFVRLVEGITAECEPGVVEEDVEPAELRDSVVDEVRGAVETEVALPLDVTDLGLESLDAPGAACDTNAGSREHPCRRPADAGRGTRDDRGLAAEVVIGH